MPDAAGSVAAAPRRKTSIMTRWPTEENPSAIFNQSHQPAYSESHWLPPVDYDDEEEEATTPGKPSSTVGGPAAAALGADDRSLEFQQQQVLSLEERQMRRKISMSNITGKVKMPSRRRSVIEFSAEFQREAAASAVNTQGLHHESGPHQQTVSK
jgi:hypothetical protein